MAIETDIYINEKVLLIKKEIDMMVKKSKSRIVVSSKKKTVKNNSSTEKKITNKKIVKKNIPIEKNVTPQNGVDKHKVWLIAGIGLVVLIVAFLLLYNPLRESFAGEATKFSPKVGIQSPQK